MEAEERESEQSLLLPELWLEIMKYLRIQEKRRKNEIWGKKVDPKTKLF